MVPLEEKKRSAGIALKDMKQCNKCKEIKARTEFSKNGSRLRSKCKTCDAIYDKEYYQANKTKKNKYKNLRRKTNPLFKLTRNVRDLTAKAFKRNKSNNWKKQTKTETLLGCTIEQLREHLAKQFQEGMSLENHGEWHIDHIVPLASAKTQQDIERLCHYTNLQPLWAEDNLKKGSKSR